ncbi:MAG: hypothetical protein ONB31_06790 [candidate division KSB1 bacterium]|nr:hypothetical protein [candidate division KSB1 bacterium]MDZ7356672.1 hypothetical protein [candidate division KSB1 bacterium]
MNVGIVRNLKIKLAVIALASVIWFFVKMEDNYRYELNVPLRITNLGPNRVISSDIPSKVKITCWGKGRSLLTTMLRKDIFYNLDVSHVFRSANLVLDKNQVKLLRDSDIEVLNIVHPETLKILIMDLITTKVAIVPDVEVTPVPGYTVVDDVKLIPDSAEVMIPITELKRVDAIFTERRRYKNINRNLTEKLRLIRPDIEHLRLLTREVNLYVNVQKLMEKPLSEVPVTVINQPPDLRVTVLPSTLSLVLEGGADILLNVTQNDIRAYIDYQKVKASQSKNHLAYIDTPKGVRYRDVKPKRFKIVVEKIK